jgi:type IV secretory pathway VirB4 component
MQQNKHIEAIWPFQKVRESGIIITKNCDISVVLSLQFPEVFCTAEDNYLVIFDAFLQAIKALGEGFVVHKQDMFVLGNYQFSNTISNQNSFSNKKLIESDEDIVVAAMEEHFNGRPQLNHKSYITITWPNSDPTKRDSLASSFFKRFSINKELLKADVEDSFLAKIRSFQATLNSTKLLEARILTKDDILIDSQKTSLFRNYFSLSFSDKALNDIEIAKGLKINNQFTQTRVINSIEQYPSELFPISSYSPFSSDKTIIPVSAGMALGLNLQFNHIYNQIFIVLKQKDLKTRLVSEIKQHNAFAAWSSDNEMAIDAKTRFNNTLVSTNALAVKAHFNILCFHESEEMIQRYGEAIDSAISSLGFVPKRATTYAEQLYWSCIPGNASEIGKDNLTTIFLDNALSLCNLETNYKDGFFD